MRLSPVLSYVHLNQNLTMRAILSLMVINIEADFREKI